MAILVGIFVIVLILRSVHYVAKRLMDALDGAAIDPIFRELVAASGATKAAVNTLFVFHLFVGERHSCAGGGKARSGAVMTLAVISEIGSGLRVV
jgi:hypothetical protein